MTEQQNPPNEPGQPQDRAGDDSKLETAKHADPLERELQAGDDAAKREADERRARLAGKGGPVGGSSGGGSGGSSGGWERDVLEKVLMASCASSARRDAGRSSSAFPRHHCTDSLRVIDFKGDVLSSTSGRHTAMVTLDGEIAAGTRPARTRSTPRFRRPSRTHRRLA
jgi:protease-4